MRLSTLLLCFLVTGPAPGQVLAPNNGHPPAESIVVLLDSTPFERRIDIWKAVHRLADEGRLTLERYLTESALEHDPKLDETLLARVEDLVARLGDAKFEVRESASEALVTIGPPALERLREAGRSGDPEIEARARRAIGSIENTLDQQRMGLRKRRLEAVRALLSFASAESAPIFLHLLGDDDEAIAELADFGLRMVSPRWPERDGTTGSRRVEPALRADWEAALQASPAGSDPVEIPASRHELTFGVTARRGVESSTLRSSRTFSGATGLPPGVNGVTTSKEIRTESIFEDVLDPPGPQPIVRRTYEKDVVVYRGPPQGAVKNFEGSTILIPTLGDGTIKTTQGASLRGAHDRRFHLGVYLGSIVPTGSYRVGDSRELAGPFGGTTTLPHITAETNRMTIRYSTSRVTYLGRGAHGRARFRIALVLFATEAQHSTSPMAGRYWAAGEVALDPTTGLLEEAEFTARFQGSYELIAAGISAELVDRLALESHYRQLPRE